MYTEMALTARRFALTLAVAGIATMGSVALAPAASADENGSSSVIEKGNGNGPDEFIITEPVSYTHLTLPTTPYV